MWCARAERARSRLGRAARMRRTAESILQGAVLRAWAHVSEHCGAELRAVLEARMKQAGVLREYFRRWDTRLGAAVDARQVQANLAGKNARTRLAQCVVRWLASSRASACIGRLHQSLVARRGLRRWKHAVQERAAREARARQMAALSSQRAAASSAAALEVWSWCTRLGLACRRLRDWSTQRVLHFARNALSAWNLQAWLNACAASKRRGEAFQCWQELAHGRAEVRLRGLELECRHTAMLAASAVQLLQARRASCEARRQVRPFVCLCVRAITSLSFLSFCVCMSISVCLCVRYQ